MKAKTVIKDASQKAWEQTILKEKKMKQGDDLFINLLR